MGFDTILKLNRSAHGMVHLPLQNAKGIGLEIYGFRTKYFVSLISYVSFSQTEMNITARCIKFNIDRNYLKKETMT